MTKLNLKTAGAATGSALGIWSVPARITARPIRLRETAPSLRVPTTRANRERLRRLRAAELNAWAAATPNASLRADVRDALQPGRGETWLLSIVAAAALGALAIGASASLDFVTHWNQFVSLVRTLVG